MTANNANGLSCKHRTHLNVDDYWLGLDILSTAWYDGNPSRYRNWANNEPNDDNKECIVYKNNGQFKDENCNSKKRFTCKKAAGIIASCHVFYVTASTHSLNNLDQIDSTSLNDCYY